MYKDRRKGYVTAGLIFMIASGSYLTILDITDMTLWIGFLAGLTAIITA